MSIPDAPPMAPPLLGAGAGAPPAPPMSMSSSSIPAAPSFSSPSSSTYDPTPSTSTSTSTSSALVPVPESDAPVSLAGIQSIPVKKTIMIVNNFVINTTEFLNKFAILCERKLQRVQQQSQRLEIVLALLEAKLHSIHWLNGEGGVAPAPEPAPAPAPTAAAAAPVADAGAPQAPAMGEGAPQAPALEGSAAPQIAAAPTGMLLKDDPRYERYFKMLRLGVPIPSLRQKMQADGVNPDIIEMDPEGPAPPPDSSSALVPVNMSDSDSGSESEEDEA